MIFGCQKVLLVEDEEYPRELIKLALKPGDYEIIEATDGEEALRLAEREQPDAIILDLMIPKIDGFEVCRRLRENRVTRHIPLLVVTARSHVVDRVKGLRAGADDYITKPYDPIEVKARLEAMLRRIYMERDMHPVTQLPGTLSVCRLVESKLKTKVPLAVLEVDIRHFKAFNDRYGYDRGDDLLRLVTDIINHAVYQEEKERALVKDRRDEESEVVEPVDLVAHLGADNFVVVTVPEKAESIAQEIIARFDQAVPELYDSEDREKGYIAVIDRRGKERHYLIATVTVVAATNEKRELKDRIQISEILNELKKHTQEKEERSVYFRDRRKE